MRQFLGIDAGRRAASNDNRAVMKDRRSVLKALLTLPTVASVSCQPLLAADEVVNSHGGPIIPPVRVPDARLRLANGSDTDLRKLVSSMPTALQLVFTRCTTTCPMQAAIFQRVQRLLATSTQAGTQLVSLSIDPEQDSPAALREWLGRFEARPGWLAAVPDAQDLPRLLAFFSGSSDTLSSHNTQVQIIDVRGRLVWRTNELPSAQSVVSLLRAAGRATDA